MLCLRLWNSLIDHHELRVDLVSIEDDKLSVGSPTCLPVPKYRVVRSVFHPAINESFHRGLHLVGVVHVATHDSANKKSIESSAK